MITEGCTGDRNERIWKVERQHGVVKIVFPVKCMLSQKEEGFCVFHVKKKSEFSCEMY